MVAPEFDVLAAVLRKVHDQICALTRRQRQQLHRDRRGEQPLIRTDLLKFQLIRERQMKKSPVGAVEYAEAVRAWLHFAVRRDLPVHQHRIAKDLGHPEMFWIGRHWIEKLSLLIEKTITKHQRYFKLARRQSQSILKCIANQKQAE